MAGNHDDLLSLAHHDVTALANDLESRFLKREAARSAKKKGAHHSGVVKRLDFTPVFGHEVGAKTVG